MDTPKLTKKQQKSQKHHQSRGERKAAKNDLLEKLGEVSDTEIPSPPAPKKDKRKANQLDGEETTPRPAKKVKEASAKRFICFLGNMPYTVTVDDIVQHFKLPDGEMTVRLQKTKGEDAKSKGFAFLEFKTAASLQGALKLHHSQLAGRKINVELSAGGGGNSAQRREKIASAKTKLDKQREKHSKNVTAKKTSDAAEKERKKAERQNQPAPAPKKKADKPRRPPQLSGGNNIRLG